MVEIASLAEYIDAIKQLNEKYSYESFSEEALKAIITKYVPQFIFRGHSDIDYKLLPGVLRWKDFSPGVKVGMYSQLESNILNDFISNSFRYIHDIKNDDYISWLEIAQHFGVPTRLLDFTYNPLVALFFACVENTSKDGSVWIINENAYNRLFYKYYSRIPLMESCLKVNQILNDEVLFQDYADHSSSNYIKYPWIYSPVYKEERMSLQSSVFMIWGANRQEFESFVGYEHFMKFDQTVDNVETGMICQLKINTEHKATIIKELDLCGINEKSIYPGLDGIGKYIKSKYSS